MIITKGKIKSVKEVSIKDEFLYDLEVKDNHNFFSNGTLISNSHHFSSDKFARCLRNCNATYRYGLTGSPYREQDDELVYHAQLGDFICQINLKQAVDAGYLTKPKFVFYEYDVMKKFKEFHQAYTDNIVENEFRNDMIAEVAIGFARKGEIVLILVNRIEHGNKLRDAIISKDYDDVVFVQGKDSVEKRKEVVDNLRKRELSIVIATHIFDEGIDIPPISVFINAVGYKAKSKYIQRIGRSLRKYEGKDIALIIDFYDNDGGYLYQQSRRRLGILSEEGFPYLITKYTGLDTIERLGL